MTPVARPGAPGVPVRVALWMLLTAIGFGAMVTIVRHLSATMDIMVITFWRNLFATVILLPWAWRAGREKLRTTRWPLYWLRAAVMVVATSTLYLGMVLMPMAEATALSFTSPLFTVIFAALILGEHVGRKRAAALAVGFAATLLILRPGGIPLGLGAVYIIVACLTFALTTVMGKQLAAREDPNLVVFYLSLLGVPCSLLPALFVWEWPGITEFGWLVLLGLAGNINYYGLAQALRLGDASSAMTFDFLRLPAVAGFAFLAFGQQPDAMTWVGAAIIFGSAVYIARADRARARP